MCLQDQLENQTSSGFACTTIVEHDSPLTISFFNFFGVRFLKCLNSKCRLKLRDCLMVAEQIGHVAGCSDCDFDFGSGKGEWNKLRTETAVP